MSETSRQSTLIGYGGRTIGREELALVPTPAATKRTARSRTMRSFKPWSRRSGFATSVSSTTSTRSRQTA